MPTLAETSHEKVSRRPRHPGRFGSAVLAATLLLVGACSGGDSLATDDTRSRPTDTGLHDHSGAASALAPEAVQAEDIATLGDGVAEGEAMDFWLGLNVCGRFVDVPAAGPARGMTVDASGLVTVAPGPGDPEGADVTVGDLAALLGLTLGTGELGFPAGFQPAAIEHGSASQQLAGATLRTGDLCGEEQAEVQLWYYTPDAVDSGESVRMVVTDPQEVPVVADGTAVTIAFAPVSSLPTLPPAALVG